MPHRIPVFLCQALFLIAAFFLISTGVQAQVTINPLGGNTLTDGLRIKINTDGTYEVTRNGRSESRKENSSSVMGIRSNFKMQNTTGFITPTPFEINFEKISEVMGSGTVADPYKVCLVDSLSYYENAGRGPFVATVLMTITYVVPNSYFVLDYTFYNDRPSTTFYLYLSEFPTMQDDPVGPILDNNRSATGYMNPPGGGPNPDIIGFIRPPGFNSDYPNATVGEFSHTYHAYNTFSSYVAKSAGDRQNFNNFMLVNAIDEGGVNTAPKGLAAGITLGAKPTLKAIGTRVAVDYGYDNTPVHINLQGSPLSTGTDPISVSFEKDSATGLEGNNGDLASPDLYLVVNNTATITSEMYVKVALVPPSGGSHNAVQGTDFTFYGGFMIPAKAYVPGDKIRLSNIKIIGNNALEYSRHMTFQLVPVTENKLVNITGRTTSVYTIQDDEPKHITLSVPAKIREGIIDSVRVTLPPGVLASERTQVDLSVVAGTEAVASDFTYNNIAYIEKDSNGVNIPVRPVKDSILEKDELVNFKADAVVMGQPQTSSKSLHIEDATRLDPTLTVLSFTTDAPALLKEPYDGLVTISLPTGVTTDLPIDVSINKKSTSTATDGTDYELTGPVTIPQGAGRITVPFKIKSDNAIEGTEKIEIELAASDPIPSTTYTTTVTPFVVNITDAQLPMTAPVILHIAANSINEGTSPGVWAELPAGLTTEIPIQVNFTPGGSSTAAAGTYTFPSGTVTIPAARILSDTVIVGTTTNQVLDDTRKLVLVGSTTDAGILIKDSLTLTINDATSPAQKKLSIAPLTYHLPEGDSTRFTIALPAGYTSAKDIVIALTRKVAGSDAGVTDFGWMTEDTLRLPANTPSPYTTTYTVINAVGDDHIIEKDERLGLAGSVFGLTGYTVSDTAVIIDDATRRNTTNTKIAFTLPSGAVNENSTNNIGFSLPAGVTTEIPVKITMGGATGTATRNTDYYLPADTTFTGASGVAVLKVASDILVEDAEDIHITPSVSDALSTVYTFLPATMDMSIKDAQYPFPAGDSVLLTSTPDPVTEGGSAIITATFPHGWKAGKNWTINLAKDAVRSTTADTSHGTIPASVTIATNAASGTTAAITTKTNNVFDDGGFIKVDGNAGNINMPATSAIINITDGTDPAQKKLTLTAVTSPLAEGSSTAFTVSLPAGYAAAKDVTIALSTNPTGTDAAAADYTALQTSIVFPKNSNTFTTAAPVIKAVADEVIEKDKQLKIKGTATGYTITDAAIQLNDATRRDVAKTKITFTLPSGAVNENSTNNIGFSLPAGVTAEIPIKVTLGGATGTATRNTDYYLPADTTFTGASGVAVLKVASDILVEDAEDIHITPSVSDALSTVYTFLPATMDMSIKDAQYPFPAGDSVLLTSTPDPVTEGGSAIITATFPHGWKAGKNWTINLAKDAVRSTTADTSHGAVPASVTIAANAASGTTAAITTKTNNVFDDGGFIKVDGNAGNTNMPATSAIINITDGTDPAQKKLTLTAVTSPLAEGSSTAFTVSLPAGYAAAKDVTITLAANPTGTDAAAADYTALQTSIVFPKNSNTFTTAAPVIKAVADEVIEKDKQLKIKGTATGYTITDAAIQLNDATRRDAAKTKISFTLPSGAVNENSTNNIGFSLPAGVTTEIPIKVTLGGATGTATRNTDYYLPADTTFTGASGIAQLRVASDILVEDAEDIHITPAVSDALSTVYTFLPSTMDMSIKDAQYPFPVGDSIILTSTPDSIYEGSSAVITATFPHGWKAGKNWVINLAKDAAASTVVDARHTAVPASVTILNNTSAASTPAITAGTNAILDDEGKLIIEGNKGNTNMPATSAGVYIKDYTEKQPNARKMTLTPDATLVPEGNKVMVTVSVPYASTKDVSIQLAVNNALTTAKNIDDYTLSATSYVLPHGQTTATFELLKTVADKVLEKNETLVVNATVNGYTINNLPLAIQDLTRSDAANLVLNVSAWKTPLTEGDSGAVTISLPAGVTTDVPVHILLPQSAGSAEAGLDYALAPDVYLNSGNSIVTGLKIKKDNFTEGPENFTINTSATDGISTYTIDKPVFTIEDDPTQYPLPAPVVLNSTLAAIDENGSGATLSAQLPNNLLAGKDITVHVTKDNTLSTAVNADHNALPSPYDIIIKKGQNKGTHIFVLKALKDLVLEDDETVVFKGSITDATFNTAVVKDTTITIKDRTHDDPVTGFIHLTAVTAGTKVLEGNTYQMKVSLAPGVTASKDIIVTLNRDAASVATAADIDNLPATVTIPAGVPDATFSFTAKTDFVLEKPELLWIAATPQGFAGMKGDKLSVTIDDATRLNPDNLKVEMRIDSSVIHEGSNSDVTIGFVNSQIISSEDVVINISRNAVSTADDADYSGVPAQVTLAAGAHNKLYQLKLTGDNILEGDEQLQFTAQLATTGYTLSQPGMVLIPETGDMRVVLQKNKDAAEPATNGAYTVKLPGSSLAAADVKVVFYVSSIAGTTNIAPVQTSAVIPAGQNSISVPVNVIDNKVIEGDEQVKLALMLAQMKRFNKNIALDVDDKDTVTLIVHDDESTAPGREMMIAKTADATEPDVPGSFRVRFSDTQLSAVKDVNVTYTVSGTAVADTRYRKLSGTVMIPAGQNGADIKVTPIDNNIVEGDEDVKVLLGVVSSSMAGITWPLSASAAADVMIHDNDTLVVEISAEAVTAAEGSGVKFTLKSPASAAYDVPVRLRITQDAARTFTTGEGTVSGNILTINMPALTKQHSFIITTGDNDINDDDGFLKAAILPYIGGSSTLVYKAGATDTARVAITDNDPLTLTFAADKFSVKEGNTGENTPLRFNVQLSRQSSRPITINYDFEASVDGVSYPYMDFKATPGADFDNTVTQTVIPALQTIGQVTVNIKGDTTFEQNETFILKMTTVSVPSGQHTPTLGEPSKATGVILNDDPMCGSCDTDGDGLTDKQEDINSNGDPFDDDTDGDGIPNFLDLDSDGDGVTDAVEKYSTDGRQINNNSGKIRVHPALSPNNDGMGNDVMYIENIDKYPNNEVVIFNRWGGTVFKLQHYDNKSKNFRGKANAGGSSGNDVPDGSYFYNIEVEIDGKKERYTGFIVIKR
ncbi:Calx-beta domain-containing protein [Chitinophaga sp. RCC_12]|uniref:Calx-beta domain-containing protein n=1 Tax=Chitinophaga sp. RCC_12 TaxID=3239226 RepID=UPI0035260119